MSYFSWYYYNAESCEEQIFVVSDLCMILTQVINVLLNAQLTFNSLIYILAQTKLASGDFQAVIVMRYVLMWHASVQCHREIQFELS